MTLAPTWPWDLVETDKGLVIQRADGSVQGEYAMAGRDKPDAIADQAVIDITRLYMVIAEVASDSELAAAPPGANAPYKIKKMDGVWAVVNNAGLVKARFGQDRDKAVQYLRALYANVKGAPARAAKTKFTGKANNRVPAPKGT